MHIVAETASNLNVFVSYCHDDGALLVILKRVLEAKKVEVLYDWSDHSNPGTNDRFEDMARLFGLADIVVAVLTDASIRSAMCRDEWVMARERGIPMLRLQQRDLGLPENTKHLLFPTYQKTWVADRTEGAANFERAAEALSEYIATLRDDHRGRATTRVGRQLLKMREMVADCAKRKTPIWKTQLMERVVKSAHQELGQLSQDRYEQNLSVEGDFIVRAGPIFQEATRVYATSLDSVSTFWLKDDQFENAVAYTACQPEETTRLFVFDGPANAHRHREVMAAHHKRYGSKGCVLFCDRLVYDHLLEHVFHGLDRPADRRAMESLKTGDFAFLFYRSQDRDTLFEAALYGGSRLICREVPQLGRGREMTQALFDSLRKTPPGKIDDRFGVSRWDESFSTEKERWKRALRTAFIDNPIVTAKPNRLTGGSNPLSGDVWHIVFFTQDVANDSEFTRTVLEQVNRMRDLPREAPPGGKLIKEVMFANWGPTVREVQSRTADGVFKGPMLTNNLLLKQYPFCLIMRLERLEDLEAYYNDFDHSACRRKIFEAFPDQDDGSGRAIRELYRLLTKTADLESRKLIYQGIEGLASRYIQRLDFVEQVDLDMIVAQPVGRFSLDSQREHV